MTDLDLTGRRALVTGGSKVSKVLKTDIKQVLLSGHG
jgi:hypothetical protein